MSNLKIIKTETRVEVDGTLYVRIHKSTGVIWIRDPDNNSHSSSRPKAGQLERAFYHAYDTKSLEKIDLEITGDS